MTGTELTNLESLIIQALPDPAGFGRRLMEQLLDRLAADGPTFPTGAVNPAAADPPVEKGAWRKAQRAQRVLQDRLVLLAAALGACECWGEDPGCAACSGTGGAGWRIPDPVLFREFVVPAAVAMEATGVERNGESADLAERNPRDFDVAGQQ